MKKLSYLLVLIFLSGQLAAQQRITKKETDQLEKNLKASPLLSDDADFTDKNTTQWPNESAVILSQKTTFEFDKKGVSAGKVIGRNIAGLIFALPTLGTSIIWANANNDDTKILVEETERRRILLRDKFALEQYSVLYFRLSMEGDAFAARVIKKDGTVQTVDLTESIRVSDIKSIPGIFRSYTDTRVSTSYRPDFFKIAVPDLEEGDIIEYEFRNFNNQEYSSNPQYKEFNPVYYLCNREMPVGKQVIEVVAQDEKYYIGYKSMKGAPEFSETTVSGKRTYRWEDKNRDKMEDMRYVNEFMQMPSVKFQVIYVRSTSKKFLLFDDEAAMKQDISTEVLSEKARLFWFQPEKFNTTGDYNNGIRGGIGDNAAAIYKSLKKKGITENADDDYVRKAYYYIRGHTLYRNWSDFAFAKTFSLLLKYKKLKHEVIVTSSNSKSDLNKVAFAQELSWVIRYKDQYFANPNEHLNPGELPVQLSGNAGIHFDATDAKGSSESYVLPLSDSLDNVTLTQIKATLEPNLTSMTVDKTVELKGMMRDDAIDEVLALTPFMETDYRNYEGLSMWEGMSSRQEEKATEEFNHQKKEWKEEKPKMMEALAESEYGYHVEKYNSFRLQQDGRSHKKRSLKYSEVFILSDMTAPAGQDLVVPIAVLMGAQPKIKQDERKRSLPVDVRYARSLGWSITLNLPAGYTVKGLENLNQNVHNSCGTLKSQARVENNTLVLEVKKSYYQKQYEVAQWAQLLEILDAAYNLSQTKIILKKG